MDSVVTDPTYVNN